MSESSPQPAALSCWPAAHPAGSAPATSSPRAWLTGVLTIKSVLVNTNEQLQIFREAENF